MFFTTWFNFVTGGKLAPEAEGFEVVPVKQKKKKAQVLSAEELALGQTLVTSRKRKRDILDNAWNRYMFNDTDQVPK
jgi:AdoMet-dependent rRNA methyltransferase SPB1